MKSFSLLEPFSLGWGVSPLTCTTATVVVSPVTTAQGQIRPPVESPLCAVRLFKGSAADIQRWLTCDSSFISLHVSLLQTHCLHSDGQNGGVGFSWKDCPTESRDPPCRVVALLRDRCSSSSADHVRDNDSGFTVGFRGVFSVHLTLFFHLRAHPQLPSPSGGPQPLPPLTNQNMKATLPTSFLFLAHSMFGLWFQISTGRYYSSNLSWNPIIMLLCVRFSLYKWDVCVCHMITSQDDIIRVKLC